jgi:ElaB/YqjD/DUF883 family membrane-anchored ribosome-binding protein
MESATNLPGDPARPASSRLKSDLAKGAKRIEDTARGGLNNLMTDVEDLVTRVAGTQDPDVAVVRDKVLKALDAVRTSMAAKVREQAIKVAGTTNKLVRVSSWQSFGIAALVGAAVGYFARRRA